MLTWYRILPFRQSMTTQRKSFSRILISALVLFNVLLTAEAQTFGLKWISSPQPDGLSPIWFCRTFAGLDDACTAFVTLATTGDAALYVNGWNVSTDILAPWHGLDDNAAVATTYDIKPYLQSGDNTLYILYSPILGREDIRQIGVQLYGRDVFGLKYSEQTDEDWLCRPASTIVTSDGRECTNGLESMFPWAGAEEEIARWNGAKLQIPTSDEAFAHASLMQKRWRVSHICQPKQVYAEDASLICDFGIAFYGFVRVTIRDAKQGEHISVGGLDYVCNGETDEQAFGRFVPLGYRVVEIKGDNNFDPEQIVGVEGIEISACDDDFMF